MDSVNTASSVVAGPEHGNSEVNGSEDCGGFDQSELLFWGIESERKANGVWTFQADEKVEAELEALFQDVLGDDMVDSEEDGLGEVWAY